MSTYEILVILGWIATLLLAIPTYVVGRRILLGWKKPDTHHMLDDETASDDDWAKTKDYIHHEDVSDDNNGHLL